MKPVRVQRKRTKGWKMPENTVYVGRPTRWGNPFKIGRYYAIGVIGYLSPCSEDSIKAAANDSKYVYVDSREKAVELFEKYQNGLKFPPSYKEIKGKNLSCWCPLDCKCHADVLLELANKEN